MSGPISTYDFTVPCDIILQHDLKKELRAFCKKWVFQEEENKFGLKQYQGRISLKVKTCMTKVISMSTSGIYWSPTLSQNMGNNFYVIKEDTRISGPWADTDEEVYIPRQIREIKKLYPWQQQVLDMSGVYDPRTVHCIIGAKSNNGKTILCTYMHLHGYAAKIPYCNDYMDLMRVVAIMPQSTCYLIDIPRAMTMGNLDHIFLAAEDIKSGHAYDYRHASEEKFFDPPCVVVFTTTKPDVSPLSTSRWKFWTITEDLCLQEI